MSTATIRRADGAELAYQWRPGHSPAVVFLPGFASDMGGTKAILLRDSCVAAGQAMLLLDYAGHGQSGGDFLDVERGHRGFVCRHTGLVCIQHRVAVLLDHIA